MMNVLMYVLSSSDAKISVLICINIVCVMFHVHLSQSIMLLFPNRNVMSQLGVIIAVKSLITSHSCLQYLPFSNI